jgi:hypothetical protein
MVHNNCPIYIKIFVIRLMHITKNLIYDSYVFIAISNT